MTTLAPATAPSPRPPARQTVDDPLPGNTQR